MAIRGKTLQWVEFVDSSQQSQRCWKQGVRVPNLVVRAEMGEVASPSGKHLKEGREEKTGISLELLWQEHKGKLRHRRMDWWDGVGQGS